MNGLVVTPLPSRRGDYLFNLHPLYSQSKFFPVNLISIPEQIARRRVFREGFDELSSGPFSRRMCCNIEVDDLGSVMWQDYETVQVAEGQCRNGEKVDGRLMTVSGLTMIKTSRQFFQICERIIQKNRSRRCSCGR